MNEDQAKRLIQKLQKSIVKGLEDVKAIDVRVFNTEALSPLFERVIIASGNSNRQTKALASSVKDQLRDDGFPKPRSEGEENGEWIIVDCGAAVVHIMQPAIRQYYHLEDIWGEKPIRLRSDRRPASTQSRARQSQVSNVVTPKPRAAKSSSAQSSEPKAAPKKTDKAKSQGKKVAASSSPARTTASQAKSPRSPAAKKTGAAIKKSAPRSATSPAAKPKARRSSPKS